MVQLPVIIFLLIFFLTSLKYFEWAFLFLIALLPAYLIRFSISGIPTTLLEIMVYIVFAVWFFRFSGLWQAISGKSKLKDWLSRKGARRYPFDIEIILLLIISFSAAAVSGFSAAALGVWKAYFFDPILFYIVVINYLCGNLTQERYIEGAKDENTNKFQILNSKYQNIFFALSVSALYISIYAIYQKITGNFIPNELWQSEATRRVVSVFNYPNAVGLYLGPLVMLFVGWLFIELNVLKTKLKNFQFPCLAGKQAISNCQIIFNDKIFHSILRIIYIISSIILSLLSIYFAKSEGALFGIIAALFTFGLLAGKWLRRLTLATVVIALMIIASFMPLKNYAVNKITLNDFSGQVRRLQWLETWEMLKGGKIITGAGLANYQKEILPYHQEGFFFNKDNDPDFRRKIVIYDEKYKSQYWQPLEIYLYPHNIFLNFWTELGLVGMLLFAWIIIKYLLSALRIIFPAIQNSKFKIQNYKLKFKNEYHGKYLIIGLFSSMIVIIVHGLVDVPYFKNDLAVMFWIFVAMVGVYNASFQLKEKNENSTSKSHS